MREREQKRDEEYLMMQDLIERYSKAIDLTCIATGVSIERRMKDLIIWGLINGDEDAAN